MREVVSDGRGQDLLVEQRRRSRLAVRERREAHRRDVTPAQPLRGRRPRAHRRVRPPTCGASGRRDNRSNAIPAKISTPPAISSVCSDSESRMSANSDGEERLQVREERRARRADAVDRREPEDVREEERPDHRVAEAEPDLPAEREVLLAELRDADERERHPADREHERADPKRRVAAHERRDRDRVAGPRERGRDRDQRAREARADAAVRDRDQRDAAERDRGADPERASPGARAGGPARSAR